MSVWAKWLPRSGVLTLGGACARLAFVLAFFALLVAPFGFQRAAWPGASAVVIAAGVCGLGGAMALAVAAWAREGVPGPQRALVVMMGGMVFRMFLPLGAGLGLDRMPALKGSGIFGLIVVFYLLTLIVETWLSLALVGAAGNLASGEGSPGTADRARGGL